MQFCHVVKTTGAECNPGMELKHKRFFFCCGINILARDNDMLVMTSSATSDWGQFTSINAAVL